MSAAPPTGLHEIMTVLLQQQARQGERVASLETSSQTIERDLGLIRNNLHAVANSLTPLSADYERLSAAVATLSANMKAQSDKLDSLLQLRNQGIGAWRALAWIAGLTAAAATLIGWALTHHFTITVN
jgi:septal ring factor EnvC (AmiA/AmiB activator)